MSLASGSPYRVLQVPTFGGHRDTRHLKPCVELYSLGPNSLALRWDWLGGRKGDAGVQRQPWALCTTPYSVSWGCQWMRSVSIPFSLDCSSFSWTTLAFQPLSILRESKLQIWTPLKYLFLSQDWAYSIQKKNKKPNNKSTGVRETVRLVGKYHPRTPLGVISAEPEVNLEHWQVWPKLT